MTKHDITTCTKNHGVKEGIRPEDWKAGANSLIPYEIRNVLGIWHPYAPPGEWQKDDDTDTFGCVSYSDNNKVEMQLNQFLYEGKLSDYKIQRCISLRYLKSKTGQAIVFANVKNNPRNFSFDLSDRALAKMSFTQPDGNFLWKVADTFRLQGVVGEARWPTPASFTWDSYYADIPQDIKNECLEFLKMFGVAYEFVTVTRENLIKHLKHVPLQVVIPGHAIVEIQQEQDVFHFFDSYEPFFKQRVGLPQTALKLVITIKPDDMLSELLKTFRIEGEGKVYAILRGKRYWITPGGAPDTIYEDGRGVLWPDVGPGDTPIITKLEAAKYPLAGTWGRPTLAEYFRYFFQR